MRLALALLAVALVAAGPAAANLTNPKQVAEVVASDLDRYWAGVFRQARLEYRSPSKIVLYHGAAASACGPAPPGNAMYCAADGGIYVSADLFRELVVARHEDFAAGVVLAHEWGHAIQDETGVLRWALRHRYLEGVELQADCYAGLFSRSAQTAGILDPGDLREAETEMASIGDRVKLSRTTPGAHGTAKQRLAWFMRGYRAAGMGGCAAVYTALYPKKR